MQGVTDIFAINFKSKVKCDMNSESHFDLWYDDVVFPALSFAMDCTEPFVADCQWYHYIIVRLVHQILY